MLNDLIGAKFCEHGADGYSCYSLVVEGYKRYGYTDIFPKIGFSVCVAVELSQELLDSHKLLEDWVQVNTPMTPCILDIQASSGMADHLGLYTGNGKFIHATIQRNVERAKVSNWKHKIKGYWVHRSQLDD